MEWIQFLIVVMTIGSFLWMARSDYRHLDAEMKDFHKRLEEINIRMVVQDAEFKAFMKAEEQKRTQIILNRK